MQVDEKARIAAADAIWNEFLYHADAVACGDRSQTPDAAMAQRISDIAITAYLSTLGEQKPVVWQRLHPVAGWQNVDEADIEHYRSYGQEIRPLYASPLPVRAYHG